MKVLLAILLALVAALYGLYLYKFPTYTYRYKVIVDVDVDGKTISGSAVREVRRWHQFITFGFPYGGDLDGEAVVVDLGSRGLLIATMYQPNDLTNDAIMTPERVLRRTHNLPRHFQGKLKDEREELWRQLSALRVCADMLQKEWPLFVRFGDIKKPYSVERVDPLSIIDNFDAGVKIRNVRICLVDEQVTREISAIMPWIDNLANGQLSLQSKGIAIPANATFAERVQLGAFIRKRRM